MDRVEDMIFVTQPTLPPLDDFVAGLSKIWESKLLSNCGPLHQQFEAQLCEYLGVPHISLFSNGTIALLTALQALELPPGGEVITTPYSFVATTQALWWNRLEPVFVDVDPVTLNLDARKIEAAISPRSVGILPVHCYGHPCDTAAIGEIAGKHKLKILYDAAHAFAVKDVSGSVLNHGDLSILSFHATKVFNTFEGGAIVSKTPEMKQRIDRLKNFGFVDEVTVTEIGLNGKMSEINSAFGMLQLKHVGAAIERRGNVDLRYRRGLEGVAGVHCLGHAGETVANYAYFPILVGPDFPLSRDGLYDRLKKNGIHGRRYFYPLISEFPMYSSLPSASAANLPTATSAAQQVLCLPIYPDLQAGDQDRVIEVIRSAV